MPLYKFMENEPIQFPANQTYKKNEACKPFDVEISNSIPVWRNCSNICSRCLRVSHSCLHSQKEPSGSATDARESTETSTKIKLDIEPLKVVVMAGDDVPKFLATPSSFEGSQY
ncbi:hypothetical protein Adt_25362 [Abeliophyllum distichum]|uniref:Uncharacterized protein n=1 Tax=Abeliophyllum distichum TaxID=126358 RepID=A0ABD1SGE8_9LAMI